jgi:serine/threonine protein kinase
LYEHGWLTEGGQYFEEMEQVADGDLTALLGFPLPEYIVLQILRELFGALRHLHTPDKQGLYLIHRDLKPANILIRSNAADFDLVLCDFGITILASQGEPVSGRRKDCTLRYSAPETFCGCITSAADYWSLGIMLFELLTGKHPFAKLPDNEIEKLLTNGARPETGLINSETWRELIAGLTDPSPYSRWGHDAVSRWLTANAPLPKDDISVDQDLLESFSFLQADSQEALAHSLIANWVRVSLLMDDAHFVRFLEATLKRLAPGFTLLDFLEPKGDADIRLLTLIYRLAPSFPPVWKGRLIDRTQLANICWSLVNRDFTFEEFIVELVDLNVLTIVGKETDNQELLERGATWEQYAHDYERLKRNLLSCGVNEEHLPTMGYVLSVLYLLGFEREHFSLPFYDIDNKLLFTHSWLSLLEPRGGEMSLEETLMRFWFVPRCRSEIANLFIVSHPQLSTVETQTSQRVWSFGWRIPTASLTAAITDYEMDICGRKQAFAKGVLLSWNVQGAFLVYLSRFGLVH